MRGNQETEGTHTLTWGPEATFKDAHDWHAMMPCLHLQMLAQAPRKACQRATRHGSERVLGTKHSRARHLCRCRTTPAGYCTAPLPLQLSSAHPSRAPQPTTVRSSAAAQARHPPQTPDVSRPAVCLCVGARRLTSAGAACACKSSTARAPGSCMHNHLHFFVQAPLQQVICCTCSLFSREATRWLTKNLRHRRDVLQRCVPGEPPTRAPLRSSIAAEQTLRT